MRTQEGAQGSGFDGLAQQAEAGAANLAGDLVGMVGGDQCTGTADTEFAQQQQAVFVVGEMIIGQHHLRVFFCQQLPCAIAIATAAAFSGAAFSTSAGASPADPKLGVDYVQLDTYRGDPEEARHPERLGDAGDRLYGLAD